MIAFRDKNIIIFFTYSSCSSSKA